ncbi:glycosyl hydrolase-related protein [Streptomyces sp. NBC_01356]|uniref:alpha-mannosidase n=1 Tax=Streptomyces sp. NBC_01356 TaxID=2903836 RepID=UPI002E31E049|nr:glycoside hydrolase family 38 C-terminal domain-containing protein [Streptomyces sp. NBC_01356]
MHDRRKSGEERIAAFLSERLHPALYPQRLPMDVGAWHIPGEPVPVGVALRADYTPFAVGEPWGSPWSTTWFRTSASVPQRWVGRRVEALIDLGADPARTSGHQAEGLVHDEHGIPLHGLHPHTGAVPVTASARGGETVRFLVEAAANPYIDAATGSGVHYGDPVTAGDTPLYRLLRADLVIRDDDVWHLLHDMRTLDGLMRALPAAHPHRHEIRMALERAVDTVDPYAVARTAAAARRVLAPVLAHRAHASAHVFAGVGQAPLDSGGLWPTRETVRGCARTFSTLVTLAEEYPELVVEASSAQHYAWMRDQQPHVFERLRKAVADGNWAPAGGTWVEPDVELAGGEALVRQFVLGRRFFRDELGTDSEGAWLPRARGASAAFPQIAALAGARWFLTGRPATDHPTAPPHDTFRWEGIDGTTLLTHLAPDTAALIGPELADTAADFTDPDGSPRLATRHPAQFFRETQDAHPHPPVWRGALDLAPHRGTYTRQARTKRGNRRSEALLHEAELWSATAAVRYGVPYPYDELDALWRRLLLQQSRHILAGTSIAWVHEDTEHEHRDLHRRLTRLVRRAVGEPDGATALNSAPHPRREVFVLAPGTGPASGTSQALPDGRVAVLAEAPALGAGSTGLSLDAGTARVTAHTTVDGQHIMDNGLLRVCVDVAGLVRSVVDLTTGRDALAPGAAGNLLQLLRDEAALDLHSGRSRDLSAAEQVELRACGPLLATVRVRRGTGRSTFLQDLTLTAGSRALTVDTEVDWRERDTALKLTWPLDVHAELSHGDVQFGHVAHPTHDRTDTAREDDAAHRWIHVGEHRWGVALAADSTYGYDVARHPRDDGTTTVVRHTLLRAARGPDPHADRGLHHFRHTLRPGATLGDAITEGYALNLPLRPGPDTRPQAPLVRVEHPDVVVETVKLADDRSGDVVVRLYEARGGRAHATLAVDFPVEAVHETDLLEEHPTPRAHRHGRVPLTLRPFQIRTLRLRRAGHRQEDSGA